MVDNAAVAYVQAITMLVGSLPNRHMYFPVLDGDGERENGTPCWLPACFGVEFTEPILAEEIAGFTLLINVFVSLFLLLFDEFLSTNCSGGIGQRRVVCKFKEVLFVEQDAMLTTPGTLVDALEGEFGIEIDNSLLTGIDAVTSLLCGRICGIVLFSLRSAVGHGCTDGLNRNEYNDR